MHQNKYKQASIWSSGSCIPCGNTLLCTKPILAILSINFLNTCTACMSLVHYAISVDTDMLC